MIRRVSHFLKRSPVEKRLFLEAGIMVPLMRIALAAGGFQRVRRLLDRRARRGRPWTGITPEIVDWAVQSVAKRTLYDRPCLTQSLVVCHFLLRGGYAPEVRIGVKKTGERLEAHAWVELNGVVVSGGRRAPEIYEPMTSLEELRL